MPTFRIQTCPSCKKEFENETHYLPCVVIYGGEEETCESCPHCAVLINQDDLEYRVRYRKEPSPIKPKTRFENMKKWLKKFLP